MAINPAKVVSYDGSFDYVVYDGMETDPDRRASLDCLVQNVRPAAPPSPPPPGSA